MKPGGAAFALGARGRLLPLSIPMRFFGASAVFHVVAWMALGIGAAQVPRFAGGADWPLAALHAATLGVLAMSAIGASLQLMPVATLQPLGSWRVPVIVWWLYTPGVALLVAGMAAQRPAWIAVAAVPVIAALLIYAALLARNLVGARGMPGVRAQGWLALVALVVALASAGAMVASWSGWAVGWSRDGLLMLHIAGKDGFVKADMQAQMHKGLDGNPLVTLHDYPERDHAFTREGGKNYDAGDAKIADDRTLAFFKQNLG